MADVPCQDEQNVVDNLLSNLDDILYQLPAATQALLQCLAENYPFPPGPMARSASDETAKREHDCKKHFDFCLRWINGMKSHAAGLRKELAEYKTELEK
jgi:hypothetical protein